MYTVYSRPPQYHVVVHNCFSMVTTKRVPKRELVPRKSRPRAQRNDAAIQLMTERLRRGLTRDELAQRAGVSVAMVRDVEEYRCQFPTRAFIAAIQEATVATAEE